MRKALMIFTLGTAILLMGTGIAAAVQALLPGSTIPKFVEPLPVAGDITVVDATHNSFPAPAGVTVPKVKARRNKPFPIAAEEFQAQILPSAANWIGGAPATCTDDDGETASYTFGYLVPDDERGVIRPSYLGPVVVAERGVRFNPFYQNNLPDFGVVQMNLPIDMTLDWANPQNIDCMPNATTGAYENPMCGEMYTGPMPIASHLHGGEVAAAFDGGPDAWFTPNFMKRGSGWPGPVYDYPNEQQESTIWFHDHALGLTRLNVYAGLAGLYPIIDPDNPPLETMPAFPAYDIPLILQDRSFDTNCEIFYNTAVVGVPNPSIHPFWTPEFVGDAIVVNGKTWPYLEVEPRQYRFRFVNGSNARFYDLTLSNGLPFIVIATDDGYLEEAVETANLVFGPGERYEVIVDFSSAADGENIIMQNAAPIPFPDGDAVTGDTAQVMQFRVTLDLNGAIADSDIEDGDAIRPEPLVEIINAHDPATGSITRQLTLNEAEGPGGPLELQVNNSKFNLAGILPGCTTPLCRETELPAVGDTEIWEIVNISADAHPMHTHLTSFQILERIPFYYSPDPNNLDDYITDYNTQRLANGVGDGEGPPNQYNVENSDGAIGGNPPVSGYLNFAAARAPLDYEMGWKDTVIAYPGEVTRIVIRWDTTDTTVAADPAAAVGTSNYPFDPTMLKHGVGYVWHCHIVDHEDNEMMRNYVVGSARQPVVPYVAP